MAKKIEWTQTHQTSGPNRGLEFNAKFGKFTLKVYKTYTDPAECIGGLYHCKVKNGVVMIDSAVMPGFPGSPNPHDAMNYAELQAVRLGGKK